MEFTLANVLILAGLAWLIYKIGQWSVLWPFKMALRHMAKRRGMDPEEFLRDELRDMVSEEHTVEPTQPQGRLEIQRHQGTYYAYENGQFIAQGPDFRGLFETIRSNFPGKTFTVDRYQTEFTDEEAKQMVQTIFDVYGDRNGESTPNRQ